MVSKIASSEPQDSDDEPLRAASLDVPLVPEYETRTDHFACPACGACFDAVVERDHHAFHCDTRSELSTEDAHAESIERALVEDRRAARMEY